MCTFNIALDDKVVNTARKTFRNDENLTAWMEEQITVLLSNYVSLSDSYSPETDKSEIELSLEEAHNGQVTKWKSVDDYFKTMHAK